MAKFNERIKRRKENNQNAFKRSFLDLAGVKISDKPSREDFIVSQLMKYFKMNTVDFPNHVNSLKDKISYLSNNNGLLLRKIELKNTWFLEYREPLLVFTKDTNVPILLIRFFGMEFILKELEEKSDAVVGWNPHCIVDAIETLVNGEDWIKPCDVEES